VRFKIIKQKLQNANYNFLNIFKENNNFLGLKEAKLRPTPALGTNLSHAFYSDWRNCLIDYSLWQLSNTRSINNQEEYIQLLGSIYAEDQSYMDKINKLLNKK
jgi:hypothetical protein